ncbi:sugar-binding protein [Pseudomonas sp. 148P]|uniref:Sugar-binding protein n=1 Tax=Pseudomonas ulcerans TaxID=3115852 RepID=A0ABU7HPC9_9PSED|nr:MULTISPECIES: sugar-binding protein [unclassified Pseudomonas]MEE1920602.1 sugar-binding protein [Pseudomonas sp. 147P]MEE1933384.1 sugar-binding protein [Pseudomonas sp. 148P]
MTTSSVVSSNAFNFMSYMNNSVDPRTGQYTLSIDLPELKANALAGPDVPLRLDFNPLNTLDSGFGLGWNLRLSQFNPNNRMLSLHTGESFKVTGTDGNEPVIKERKLDTFRFFIDDDETYRVVHKSGLVEILKVMGIGANRIALPRWILGPSGHQVELGYASFNGMQRLASVADASGELLRITRTDNSLRLLLPPFDDDPLKRFEMKLTSGLVMDIVLPVPERASWRFRYEPIRGVICVREVSTPLGGREYIEYNDPGHAFPGNTGRANLPRVTEHRIDPGSGQDVLVTRYAYSNENFLGNGANISWDDDGLDQLYKVTYTYEYTSTASHLLDGQKVREVKRTFNRFHLMTEEVTQQGKCVKRVGTEYHQRDVPFDQQPAIFQLPKRVETRWEMEGDATRFRVETVETEFDIHGNPTLEVQANGVRTASLYYAADGEDGCPPDPDKFVRHLKEQTVTPASGGEGDAPVLTTHYRYQELPPLAGAAKNPWLVLAFEELSDRGTPLQQVHHEYHDQPADSLLHGRLFSEGKTLNGLSTFTDYRYEVLPAEGVLQTQETLTGFDKTSKTLVLQHALLIGEPVQTHDDNDVVIRYAYDSLRRITAETVAPDSDFEATRTYAYTLTSVDGQKAVQETTDVKGVQTRNWVDGLNRQVLEQRQDVDGDGTWRDTSSAHHDGLGQLDEACEFDWLAEGALALRHRYAYDDWGQQRADKGPDDVVSIEETDPIGTPAWRGPVTRTWQESANRRSRSGETVTWVNLFGKPARSERLDSKGEQVSLHEYFYDGLGRTRREVDALDHTTTFAYDAFDRLVENVLPGGAVVSRRFVEHSDEDLPTHISVDGQELGQQHFDGLSRMVESITGGRKRVFEYEPGRMQPTTVTTPAGVPITYDYQPQLGEDPMRRELAPGVAATYEYDLQNARLLHCEEQGQILEREYFSTGDLSLERRFEDGQVYEMTYRYSLRGRLLGYTDVLGQVQSYEYDSAGRLVRTELDAIASSFTYDALGRLHLIDTRDSDQQVQVTLEYDDFARETLRHFDFGTSTQALSQEWNAVDRLTRRTLLEDGELLRDEDYGYDERNRLTDYSCTGEPPLDAYGQPVQAQLFRFDAMDNITRVLTTFPGGQNRADYHYDNADDPTQLTSVSNDHEAYPAEILLSYDADGNLVSDEQGRQLDYDALGRLVSVGEGNGVLSGSYRYDPLDRLASLGGGAEVEQRFYREEELANVLQGDSGSTFVRGAGNLLAERQSGAADLLLGCDQKNTVLRENVAGQGTSLAYTAHGYRSPAVRARLGFNGEFEEREAGGQLLGKDTDATARS